MYETVICNKERITMSDKPVVTGISLTENEKAIVARESERRGLYNFSATIRQIIREWDEMQNQPTQPNNSPTAPVVE